jgi:hypothetical protein
LGFRPDGYLVPDMVGGSVVLFGAMILLHVVVEFPYAAFLSRGDPTTLEPHSPMIGAE